MSGKVNISQATDFLSDSRKDILNETDTTQWRRLHNWASWWCRPSHLQMFTKAFTKLSNTQWKNAPKTTNPVESINKQSVNEKGSSLYTLLENIYTEDRAHATKLVRFSATLRYRIQIQMTEGTRKKAKKGSDPVCWFRTSTTRIMHHQINENTLTAMV